METILKYALVKFTKTLCVGIVTMLKYVSLRHFFPCNLLLWTATVNEISYIFKLGHISEEWREDMLMPKQNKKSLTFLNVILYPRVFLKVLAPCIPRVHWIPGYKYTVRKLQLVVLIYVWYSINFIFWCLMKGFLT